MIEYFLLLLEYLIQRYHIKIVLEYGLCCSENDRLFFILKPCKKRF